MSQHEGGLTRWFAESISPVEMFTQARPIAVGTPPMQVAAPSSDTKPVGSVTPTANGPIFSFRLRGLACRDGFGGPNFYW